MRFSRNRAINDRVLELIKEGWVAEHGGKHYKVKHPNGYVQLVPGSPGDHRSQLNFMAQLKRAERNGFRPIGKETAGQPTQRTR